VQPARLPHTRAHTHTLLAQLGCRYFFLRTDIFDTKWHTKYQTAKQKMQRNPQLPLVFRVTQDLVVNVRGQLLRYFCEISSNGHDPLLNALINKRHVSRTSNCCWLHILTTRVMECEPISAAVFCVKRNRCMLTNFTILLLSSLANKRIQYYLSSLFSHLIYLAIVFTFRPVQ